MFKPRRPVTRHLRRLQEAEPEESETREVAEFLEGPMVPSIQSSLVHKDDRGKTIITHEEECSFEEVKKKLVFANIEISQLKERERKNAVEKANFKRVKSSWEDGKVSRYEVVGSHAQYFTWTVLAIKEARYVRRVNAKLRTRI